jgi:hypothetical protein
MIGGAEPLKGKVRIIWCNLLVKFKERGKKQRQAGLTVANFFLFFFCWSGALLREDEQTTFFGQFCERWLVVTIV